MRFEVSYRQAWELALPIMLSSLAVNVINVTNTYFLGHVPDAAQAEVYLGASTIGGIFYYVLVMIGLAFSTGTQILVARRTGEQRDQEVGAILDHSIYLNLALGAVLFVVLKFASPFILQFAVPEQTLAVRAATTEYLSVRAYEIFFSMFFWMFRGFYTGLGKTYIIIYGTVVLALVNVSLDYLFIVQHGLGIRGAAYASICAEGCAALMLFANLYWQRLVGRYNLLHLVRIDWQYVRQLFDLSLPLVAQNLISMVAWLTFFLLIADMGQAHLAASGLIRSIYMVVMIPSWAFGAAANAMVSNVIGQARSRMVLVVARQVLTLSTSVSVVIALLVSLLPHTLLGLLTDNASIQELAVPGLLVVAASTVLLSASIVLLYCVTGTGATRVAFRIEVLLIAAYILYLIVVTQWLHAGMTVAWLVEPLYWILMIVFCGGYLISGRWRGIKI